MKLSLGWSYLDKVAITAALIVFFASAYVTFRRFQEIDKMATENVIITLGTAKYKAQLATVPDIETSTWKKAPSQSGGRDWVYDVFTPPVIYYNPVTLQFTVSPPDMSQPTVAMDDPFHLELLNVKPRPYRVQLVGYVGGPGDYRCTLQDVATGDTMLVRAGDSIASLDVTVVSFDVKRVTQSDAGGTPVIDYVATAVVHDDRSGERVVLNNREKTQLPELVGVFRLKGDPVIEYQIKEGGTIRDGKSLYTINNLYGNPPQASVTLTAPGLDLPVFRTITPVAPEAAPAAANPKQ